MNRRLASLPYFGIFTFLGLYVYACSLYPGGTKFDQSTLGYSQLGNFWCDLLDTVSYSGKQNPGRPFALAATLILPFSLIFFWYYVPTLFKGAAFKKRVVQVTGCLSMALAIFIFTPVHD